MVSILQNLMCQPINLTITHNTPNPQLLPLEIEHHTTHLVYYVCLSRLKASPFNPSLSRIRLIEPKIYTLPRPLNPSSPSAPQHSVKQLGQVPSGAERSWGRKFHAAKRLYRWKERDSIHPLILRTWTARKHRSHAWLPRCLWYYTRHKQCRKTCRGSSECYWSVALLHNNTGAMQYLAHTHACSKPGL